MKNTRGGFVQIPLLVALLVLGALVAGSSYYSSRNESKTENVGEEVKSENHLASDKLDFDQRAIERQKTPASLESVKKESTSNIKPVLSVRSEDKGQKNIEQFVLQLTVIKGVIDSVYEAGNEVREKIISSETKISDFRIDKLGKLADLSPVEIIRKTYGELIAIEEIRKDGLRFILSDSLMDMYIYSAEVGGAIKLLEDGDFENGLPKAQTIIDTHGKRFSELKEKSKSAIDSTLAENKAYAQEFLLRMDSTGAIAERYISALTALEEIKRARQEIAELAASLPSDGYFSPPIIVGITAQTRTGFLTCEYPISKYILVPGKGWVAVKMCSDGRYIEADKYVVDTSKMTPRQICDLRYARWADQGAIILPLPGCSDLGL